MPSTRSCAVPQQAPQQHAKVRLVLPDGSVYERPGRLNFTGSAVDPKLGTVQLRAEFANPSLALLPGQFVKARVEIGARDAFLVPQAAVLQADRGRFVWVVDASNKATQRPVETGAWAGRDWVINSGLKAGDRVIGRQPDTAEAGRHGAAEGAGRGPGAGAAQRQAAQRQRHPQRRGAPLPRARAERAGGPCRASSSTGRSSPRSSRSSS